MARSAKPWFNRQKNCWVVWFAGRRVKLTEGKKNKKAAQDCYDELRYEAIHNPHPDGGAATVASVIERYRSLAANRLSAATLALPAIFRRGAWLATDMAAMGQAILASAGVETLHIEPGSPWQNGYAESFNSRLRDELLNVEVFKNVLEAHSLGVQWRNAYNHHPPHGSLGYQTPTEYAARRAASAPAAPTLQQHRRIQEALSFPKSYSHNRWYEKWGHFNCAADPRHHGFA